MNSPQLHLTHSILFMADNATNSSTRPGLHIFKRLSGGHSGKKTKFTARMRNMENGEMDALGTFDTKEEAEIEYDRIMSSVETTHQSLHTPARTKRRRAAADVDIEGLTNHDGMTDSILKDYLSSSMTDTPTSLKAGVPGSMFDDEVEFEDFETPEKVQCPSNKKDLLQPSVDSVFFLGSTCALHPRLAQALGNFLTTHRDRPAILASIASIPEQWDIRFSIAFADALQASSDTISTEETLQNAICSFLSFAAYLNNPSLLLLSELAYQFREYCHNTKGSVEASIRNLMRCLSRPTGGGAGASKKITWEETTNVIITKYIALPVTVLDEMKPHVRLFYSDGDTYITVNSPSNLHLAVECNNLCRPRSRCAQSRFS